MHKITCSECDKEAEVPFRQKRGLQVYCQECFIKKSMQRKKEEKHKEEEEGINEEKT
ncbi:MAG: hypothetical protein NZ889_02340 [Candidatus Pacearchaeota archaeon]|nr:hypothetical protein [Candidatus Pacearchaeota archaeon]